MALNRKRAVSKQLPERKKEDELQELFVFGYQCKLFHDDDKAMFIDKGKHLIPWMGDPSLMIDRYDGRGHLFDLTPYLSKSQDSYDLLTEEERQIEALCDEERYLELHTDINEKAMYEEEELKRLNEALQENDQYLAVGFNYDQTYDPEEPTDDQEQQPKTEEEEVYVPSPTLRLQATMPIPKTVKENVIIEKTAWFVSQQGGQMEIMVKAKQKDNPQFGFLDFSNNLNPYYKHLLRMMKCGKYKPTPTQEKSVAQTQASGHYLHPSLAISTSVTTVSAAPEPLSPQGFLKLVQAKVPSGQLENSVYATLVSKMSKHTGQNSLASSRQPIEEAAVSRPSKVSFDCDEVPLQPPPMPPMMLTHDLYMSGQSDVPPPPGLEPVTLPGSLIIQPPPPGTVPTIAPTATYREPHYKEEVEEDSSFHGPAITPPPPDLEPIVDKMASYVARNGPEFEMTVRNKGDPRFQFLHSYHVHYPYYAYKKRFYLEQIQQEKEKDEDTLGQGKGLSFSIKTKMQETKKVDRKRSALPVEESDDENEGGTFTPTARSDDTASTEPEDTQDTDKQPISQEQLQKKIAEEKLKDKLAVAARDKLAQASKEKQLQAERKRKAAMFINLLKSGASSDPVSASTSTTTAGMSPATDVTTPALSPCRSRSGSPIIVQNKRMSPVRRFSPTRVLYAGKAAIEKRRSRSKSPRRRRSRSPKSRKSRTSPTSYFGRHRSKSRSPIRSKRSRRSQSRSPKRDSKSSKSRSHHRKRSRSRSRTRSHRKKRSRSPKDRKSKRVEKNKDEKPKPKSNKDVSVISSTIVKEDKAVAEKRIVPPDNQQQNGSPEEPAGPQVKMKAAAEADGTLINIDETSQDETSTSTELRAKIRAMLKKANDEKT